MDSSAAEYIGDNDFEGDDPKTEEIKNFAVTALESFELQAILAVKNNESLARTRHNLLKQLIGIPTTLPQGQRPAGQTSEVSMDSGKANDDSVFDEPGESSRIGFGRRSTGSRR